MKIQGELEVLNINIEIREPHFWGANKTYQQRLLTTELLDKKTGVTLEFKQQNPPEELIAVLVDAFKQKSILQEIDI